MTDALPEPLSLTLRHIKQHRELTVDLRGKLLVLVGPNGVGKSTVLKAIRAVGALVERPKSGLGFAQSMALALGESAAGLSEAEQVLQSWSRVQGASIDIGFAGGTLHFEPASQLRETSLVMPGSAARLVPPEVAQFDERARDPHVHALRSTYLQPEFSALARPSRVELTTLGPAGANLATVIAQFALRFPRQQQQLLSALRAVVPEVRFVGATTKTLGHDQVYELEVEFEDGARLRGADVSEGTLISLAVLALVHQEPHPRVVLLDDVDRGLHPVAQKALVEQLRALAATRPDLKIICTSHSPYLVEHFQAAEVRILGRRANGETICKRLDEHPEWSRYQTQLDSGSFWASVGEGWVGAS